MSDRSILTREDYEERLVLHKSVIDAIVGKTFKDLSDKVVDAIRAALGLANEAGVNNAKLVNDLVNRNRALLLQYNTSLRFAKWFNEDGTIKSNAPDMPPGLVEVARPDKAKHQVIIDELDNLRPRLESLLS